MENRSGNNGFYPKERWVMCIVCIFFMLIFAFNISSATIARLGKGKDVTTENCREYVNIDVYGVENFNPEEYIVQISGRKKVVYDFTITVEVRFEPIFTGESYTQEFSFSDNQLSRDEKLKKTVFPPNHMYRVYVGTIISVAGRVK